MQKANLTGLPFVLFMALAVLQDFIHLFYPELCAACERQLMQQEKHVCLDCKLNLPKTGFHLQSRNPIEQIFWGRVPLKAASAYVYFQKKGSVQRLMHQIKYKGKKEVAETLGRWYGRDLLSNPALASADHIIPMPLHGSKLKSRGYNQSEYFAKGLSNSLQIPLDTELLIRARKSETQTRKSRFMRWENVSEIFQVTDAAALEHKHVILVDDVITTGATLESCAQTLLSAQPAVSISIVTLAFANG